MSDDIRLQNDAEDGQEIPVKVKNSIQASIQRAKEERHEADDRMDAIKTNPTDQTPSSEDQTLDSGNDLPLVSVKRNNAHYQFEGQAGKKTGFSFKFPPQHRRKLRPHPESITDNERTWSTAAHASALLTIAVGMSTGIGGLITIFLPLMIYLYYRDKSEYVAHHALQAFAAQVVGIGGFFLLATVISVTWTILIVISAILILLLVGIVLLPIVLVAGMIALAATFLLPLTMLIYSMIAAVESWNGHNYSYPWIGDWVDDQLYGQMNDLI